MIFNTWVYAIFLATSFVVYWFVVPARWRLVSLTLLGGYFYWYYYPPHLILIVLVTLAVHLTARWIFGGNGTPRRALFAVSLALLIGALAYYKYQGFLVDSLATLTRLVGWQVDVAPALVRPPLAISFFTFEFIHYLIEVYRGTFAAAGLRDFSLFILFFPTLICGPIKRFGDFHPQEAGHRLQAADIAEGLERILFGLAKKTLVADQVAPFCSRVFAEPSAYGWATLWLAVYGYSLQIYFDFAGYSDIAIGSARLFGYRVPENFNFPYLQPNLARFWRCWHMSLTSWITDYVYIPLGGNRRGEARAYWNRLLSMALCGLWHGAAFHFVVWGVYHGVGLNLFRAWQQVRERWWPQPAGSHWLHTYAAAALNTLVTFHVVAVGWVLFVCDLERSWYIIRRLLWAG